MGRHIDLQMSEEQGNEMAEAIEEFARHFTVADTARWTDKQRAVAAEMVQSAERWRAEGDK